MDMKFKSTFGGALLTISPSYPPCPFNELAPSLDPTKRLIADQLWSSRA